MKSKYLGAGLALGLWALASVANAATVTLDFEDGIGSGNGPSLVHTYDVGGIQIDFANAIYVNMTGALPAGMAIGQYNLSAPITVTFSKPVLSVSVLARGAAVAEVPNRLRAYGPGDVLLATDSHTAIQQTYEFGILSCVVGVRSRLRQGGTRRPERRLSGAL